VFCGSVLFTCVCVCVLYCTLCLVTILVTISYYIFLIDARHAVNGFGGLVVSMLASGTQDRGFKPGHIRRIFHAKKFTACLPSEGK
jgi:hypothetical protein